MTTLMRRRKIDKIVNGMTDKQRMLFIKDTKLQKSLLDVLYNDKLIKKLLLDVESNNGKAR